MPTPYERLKRWRDVGDGPIKYVAGDSNFGADVVALLAEVERLREMAKQFAVCGDFSGLRRNDDTFKNAVRIKRGETP